MSADEPEDNKEAAPPPAPPSVDVPRASRKRLRILLALAAIVGALVAVLLITRARRSPLPTGTATATRDGGAAVRAPEGPAVPIDPTGVRLTGFVIDGAGTPVAGAEVSAELEEGAADRALAPAAGSGSAGSGSGSGNGSGSAGKPPPKPAKVPSIWPKLAGGGGSSTPGPGVHVAAPTGADGKFVIGGLEAGRFRLRVTGPGLLPAEVRFVPVPSDATRIVVARQVAIAGTVTDGGKLIPNVSVGLRGDAIGGGIEIKTDLAGAFTFADLPEGRYQLYAYQGALAARTVRVSRLGTGPFAPVELRLEAASIVVGRVIEKEEGTPLIAAIELRPSGDDEAPRYARTGPDGVFKIEGVPNGRWIADAFSPGYLSPGGVELEAGKGIPELALVRGAMIEGRVLDAQNKPVEGAAVRALGTDAKNVIEQSELIDQDKLRRFSGRMAAPVPVPGGISADPQLIPRGELGVLVGPIPPLPPPGVQVARPSVVDPTSSAAVAALVGEPAPLAIDPGKASIWVTGRDGKYRIRGLAKGTYGALAVATGYAEGRSKEVTLDATQALANVDIVLAPGTYLIGKVTDQHNVPVIGALVSARPKVGAQLDTFTDEAGAYRLGPLTGELELFASAYGHGEAKRAIDIKVTKSITAIEQREDLVLVVADATLAGTLDDTNGTAVGGAQIEVVGGAGDGRGTVVASDGTFKIEMLPEGPLRVRVRHPDYPPRVLEATATTGAVQRVRLRLPIGGAVEGAAIDASSASPLTSILVTGKGPNGAAVESTTDKAGRWRLGPLEPGRWNLTIKLPGYLPVTRELDVTATRTPGGVSLRDIRLELARGALVGGTVRDSRGQRVVGAQITVLLAAGTGTAATGTTDNLGEFRVRDVPTGDLIITAIKDELRGATRVTVRAGTEVLGLSIDLR